MSELKICKKCLQPNTRPGIFFDEYGICGACLWEDEKLKINWENRHQEFKQIIKNAKSKKSNYDCAIGVSGGKDSTTQAIIAKENGLNCLLVNSEPNNITEIGRKNIENLKNLGFDVISIRTNPKTLKKLMKYDFYTNLNPVKITEFSLWASTYIIAEKFDIPLIIQGENPGLTLGTRLTGVGTNDNSLNANKLQTLSSGWERYLEEVNENDLFLFKYDSEILEKKGIRGIWLNYYFKDWSNYNSLKTALKNGFSIRDESIKPEDIGTYVKEGSMPGRYFQLDTDMTQVNQLLKFIKFGFGQCMDHVCYDIREELISRKKGIELVRKYDGKCSMKYIKKFTDFIGITTNEFWDVAEKFRGNMWKKNTKGEQINEIWKCFDYE